MTELARPASLKPRPLAALRRPGALPLTLAVLLATVVLATAVGPADIGPDVALRVIAGRITGLDLDVSASAQAIVWEIRLPRVLLAGLVGAILACSGAAYQGVFRNPLADPYLLGVASGAGLAGVLAIVLDLPLTVGGFSLLPVVAFMGSMTAVALAYSIARVGGQTPASTMILAGISISSIAVAGISYLMILNQENTSLILSWLLGSFNGSGWHDFGYVLPYALPALAVVFLHGRLLNVLQVDDAQAGQLGVNVELTRAAIVIAASLAAAAAVSVSGTIGFVGLIAPHAVRLLIGPDYRRLLPVVALVGASFVILADLGARTLVSPGELPVGVITALAGAPFFLYLLRRQRKAFF